MKKSLLILVLISLNIITYGQDWLWSGHFTGDGNNQPQKMAVDTFNNTYVTGKYDGTVDPIVYPTMTSFGATDIFISKYNQSGTLNWIKRIGGVSGDTPGDIAVSNDNQNIFVAGNFQGDCKFDTDTLTSEGSFDVFLAKYSVNGGLIWAKNIAWGNQVQQTVAIDVDSDDNVVITGFFKDSIEFGDSINAANHIKLYGKVIDNFILKLNSDGSLIWAKILSSKNNFSRISDISSCDNGYYVGGQYRDSIFFDIDSLYNAQTTLPDLFIYKTDYNGDGIWLRKIEGTNAQYVNGIDSDENNDIYITSYYKSTDLQIDSTDTEISLITPINKGNYDALLLKYDANGTLQWLDFKGGSGIDTYIGIDSKFGDVLASGYYSDTIFHGSDTLIKSGSENDAFFASYDYFGTPLFGKTLRGNLENKSIDCVIDQNNNYLLTGYFHSDTLFIESDIDTTNIDTLINPLVGSKDMFIAKYGCQVVTMSFLVDSVDCVGDTDGEIILQPSVTDNYIYTWTGGFMDNDTISSVAEGTYYVTVTSPRGCMYTDSVTMAALPTLQTSMIDSITINCIAGNDGVAIVTPVDGVGPFTYAWSVSASTDSTANDLTVGLHYVTVLDMCSVPTIDSVNVGYMPTLSTSITSHSILVLCETSTDGEATVTPVNGVGPFDYLWTTSANDTLATNNNLSVGLHYVTVLDVCNVPTIDSVRVNYLPTMNASITESEDASCSSTVDGQAFVFTTSGVPPYDYIWDNGDTLAQTIALNTGWHYVTVTDFCISVVDSVLIDFNPVMTIDFSSHEDVSCPGLSDGEACIEATDGTLPYYYNWAGSASTNACVNDLAVGWQTVTVTDACGALIDSIFIGTTPTITTLMEQTVLATCTTDSNATATVTTTNGAAPISYVWSNSASTDTIATDLPVGWQYVTITDGCGSRVDSIDIAYVTPLSSSYIETDVLCNADTSGQIVLIPSDGVAPFTYIWTGVSDSDSVAVNLPAGIYSYTITDACGSVTGSVELTEPGAISVSSDITNESFTGTGDGEIDILVSGGVPPYIYAWSDYDNTITEDLTNLSEDTFYVTITDYNYCTLVDTFVVETEYKYIEIKNAFTPNGDGTNDEWTIKYIEQYPGCKVNVYNQWGMNVFSSQGYNEKWNGKKDNTGNDLPAAAYYYIIDLGDGSDQHTGAVTIIR